MAQSCPLISRSEGSAPIVDVVVSLIGISVYAVAMPKSSFRDFN